MSVEIKNILNDELAKMFLDTSCNCGGLIREGFFKTVCNIYGKRM